MVAIDLKWRQRVMERRQWEAEERGVRFHPPAMVNEVLDYLRVRDLESGIFVDMTVGTGGHTLAILQANPKVKVIGIDIDRSSLEIAAERLADYAGCVMLIHGDMRDVRRLLKQIGINRVDGCLIDPGMSLWQVDSGRGFSYSDDTPLDMRYDLSAQITAQTLLQTLSAAELEGLFVEAGERRHDARCIAQSIVQERRKGGVWTGRSLAKLVMRVKGIRKGHLHPAAKVFMALRMTVNEELDALRTGIMEGAKVLSGRFVVLTYQSQEDRIVKSTFQALTQSPLEGEERAVLRVLTKKPVRPSIQERKQNPRTRSCKLRAAERVI